MEDLTSFETGPDVPSRTAWSVALARAAHRLLDPPPWILDDPVAPELIGPDARRRILDHPADHASPYGTGLRMHLVVRSRFAEDRMLRAIRLGTDQLVVLGAGYDTFCYRQPRGFDGVRLVEIDAPATQAAKLELLARNGIPVPPNVRHFALDFRNQSLEEGLRRSGLDLERPVFFSWLGVSMYLDPPTVREVLSTLGRSAIGSGLAFTFANRDEPDSPASGRAASLGERWKSSFSCRELTEILREAGFDRSGFLGPEEIRELYFKGRTDLPAPRRTNTAWAAIGGDPTSTEAPSSPIP